MPQDKKTRKSLTPAERKLVRAKTGGRCHVCGGSLGKRWSADHVLAHCRGGRHAVDNYLPACGVCNRLRWHYKPGRVRKILTLGIYMAKEIGDATELGKLARTKFNDRKRQSRTRRKQIGESMTKCAGSEQDSYSDRMPDKKQDKFVLDMS